MSQAAADSFSSNAGRVTSKRSTSVERRQVVVFMRHGVARHNVVMMDSGGKHPDYRDPALLDPPLVWEGKAAALTAGERLQDWWYQRNQRNNNNNNKIDLIATSPLTRCMQTAVLAFLPGNNYAEETAQQQPQQSNPLKIVAVEHLREAYGINYPDRRRHKSLLANHWPFVEFDASVGERDDRWKPNERETRDDVAGRVDQFLTWLVRRPEQNVVVVSHGVWIETLLQRYAPTIMEDGRRVYNCDAFACVCVSVHGNFMGLDDVRHVYAAHNN